MKTLPAILLAACAASLPAAEEGFSFVIDRQEIPMSVIRPGFPGFAYADTPVPGGEDTVLKYRHAGAWTFRTASADEAMLKYAKAYGLRLVLLVDGEPKDMSAKLNALAAEAYRNLVVGVQLGEKVISKDDVPKWNSVVSQVQHRFPKVPVAMPAAKGIPEVAKLMPGVTHLIFDLRNAPSPHETLRAAYAETMASKVPCVRNIRFWALAAASVPGETDDGGFRPVLWNLHWMLTAFASEKFDAVIFDRPAKDDPFGWAMRFAALAFRDHPRVLLHGEGSASKASDSVKSAPEIDIALDGEEGVDGGLGDGPVEIKATPKACANFAAKRGGDVEYLVLDNGGPTSWEARICVLVVNSGEKTVKMSVEMKRGKCGNGDARRVLVDPETGKVRREGLGFYVQPGMPLVRRVAPHSIETLTFVWPK